MQPNFTDISFMTDSQIIQECHNTTAIFPLVSVYIVTILSFLLFGFLFVKHSESRKKLIGIIFYSSFLSGLLVVFLSFSPNITQVIIDFFIKLFT